MPGDAGARTVQAAGAVCWRRDPQDDDLQVLLVHSARWDEWSWPKGKLEADESHAEAAVREVAEETGVRIVLGPPLAASEYTMPDGRPKRVVLWAAQPLQTGAPTAGSDEIAGHAWLSVAEARERLDHDADRANLDRLVALDRDGHLDGGQLIVVRHGKSVPRAAWDGPDHARPLAKVGLAQAERLARLLDCWRPAELISSPWSRCLGTMAPYEGTSGLTIEAVPALSESGYAKHPRRTQRYLHSLVSAERRIALCTHRPVLAGIQHVLRETANSEARQQLPDRDPWLAPGQLLVAHHRNGAVFSVELH